MSSSELLFLVNLSLFISRRVSIWVCVRSVGLHPECHKISIVCLCEEALYCLHSHRQKGPPLNSDKSPPGTHRKSDLLRVPYFVTLGSISRRRTSLGGN